MEVSEPSPSIKKFRATIASTGIERMFFYLPASGALGFAGFLLLTAFLAYTRAFLRVARRSRRANALTRVASRPQAFRVRLRQITTGWSL